jgi:hypothetical protein
MAMQKKKKKYLQSKIIQQYNLLDFYGQRGYISHHQSMLSQIKEMH